MAWLMLSSCVMVKFRTELTVLDVLSLTISAFSILPLVSPPHVPLARLPYPTAESGPLLKSADQADSDALAEK